ncbi:hypothetical protein [Glutamicibacter nicotianae]|uniref:hypothetical protein n=1 Tax=Glutamicibacter nicotianae TaxID=37929 RepID=UPI001FC9A44B|nr:hypothetical protein [Glutamicibacter nicotianae]
MTRPIPQNDSERWMLLRAAHHQYHVSTTANYDEVLFDVAERFATHQSIGKVEIGGLLIWKRLQANTRWAMDLMNVPDQRVHELTRDAYLAANDLSLSVPEAARAARSAFGSLPGFKTGDALASAVLLAAAPQRLAVYDRRAHHGLNLLGLTLTSGKGRYSRYMDIVEHLRHLAQSNAEAWTARDVDVALYKIGGPR